MISGLLTLQMRQLRKQVTKRFLNSPSLSSILSYNYGASQRKACLIRCNSLKNLGEPSWQSSRNPLWQRKWWSSWEYLGKSTWGYATTMPKQIYSNPLQYLTCWSSIAYLMSESYIHCMISFSCWCTRRASQLLPRYAPIAFTILCILRTFCFRLRTSLSASQQERMVKISCLLCWADFSFVINSSHTPIEWLAISQSRILPVQSLLFRERTALRYLRVRRDLHSGPPLSYCFTSAATSFCLRQISYCQSCQVNS